MLTKPHLLDHARASVERTARSLDDLRATLHSPSAARLGRQHRLLIDGALLDLARRHELLSGLYAAMSEAPEEQVAVYWQQFFACYDAYLEAVRDARTRLGQEQSTGATAPPRHGPADTVEGGT